MGSNLTGKFVDLQFLYSFNAKLYSPKPVSAHIFTISGMYVSIYVRTKGGQDGNATDRRFGKMLKGKRSM